MAQSRAAAEGVQKAPHAVSLKVLRYVCFCVMWVQVSGGGTPYKQQLSIARRGIESSPQ
jgi:hypothetical protein